MTANLSKAIEKNTKAVTKVALRLLSISRAFYTLNMTEQANEHFDLAINLLTNSYILNESFNKYLKDN